MGCRVGGVSGGGRWTPTVIKTLGRWVGPGETLHLMPRLPKFSKSGFSGLLNPVFRFTKFSFFRISRVSGISRPQNPDLLHPVFRLGKTVF